MMKWIIVGLISLMLMGQSAGLFARDDKLRRLPTQNSGLMKQLLLDNEFPYIEGTQESILEWVSDNITYKDDKDTWGISDYWQTPEETMLLRTGDCEDFTILAMALLNSIGIYSELVLCDVADGMNGKEWEDEPDREIGGHAMLWIFESNEQLSYTLKDWKHNMGYYEPQTGRKVIYQYTFWGHLNFNQTMQIAYIRKNMRGDTIPEIIEE